VENIYCLRCNRELGTGHKIGSQSICLRRRLEYKPRQKSRGAAYFAFARNARFPWPWDRSRRPLSTWQRGRMMRDLVGFRSALNQPAWQNLSAVLGTLPPTGTEGARPFDNFRRVFRVLIGP